MKEQHEENVKTLANLDAVLRQKLSQDRAEFEKLEQLEKQFQEMASSGPKGAPELVPHFDVSPPGGSPVKSAAAATKDADEE